MPSRNAFTLIELLVVVGILALLSAIAVPNMQLAMVRSKVATVRSDHRTIAAALEAYHVDNKFYPEDYAEYRPGVGYGMGRLTSPVAYLTSVMRDPFGGYIDPINGKHIISYTLGTEPDGAAVRWMLTSAGPNQKDESSAFDYPGFAETVLDDPSAPGLYLRYDPTNGSTSSGDIMRAVDASFE